MLPRKFEIPSLGDWAWASTASKTVAASMTAAARLTIDDPVSPIVPYPFEENFPVSKGLVTVSNRLTSRILFLTSAPDRARNDHHTSAFVPGCKPATNA